MRDPLSDEHPRGTESESGDTAAAGGALGQVEESRRLQSLFMTAARMAAAAFTMAIPMVLARVLDQTTFGYYKQLFLIAMTAGGLLTLGIPGSLYYFVPRSPRNGQRYQVQSLVILSLLGAAGGLAVLVGATQIERLFNDAPLGPYIPWIALFTALSIPAELLPASPMVDRRARLAAILVTGLDLVRALLLVIVALITRDLTTIIVAATVVVALKAMSVVAYLAWRRKHSPGRSDTRLLRSQMAYALPFAGTAVIGLLRNKLHAFFVAANFSAAEFAIYAVATLSIPFIGQFTQTVGEVVILENSKNFEAGRRDEMRHIWHRATYSLALVLIPIYVLGVVFAQDIMVTLFGAQYATAAPIFQIYLTLIPLSLLLASPMLRATADLRLMLVADIVSLIVAIVSLVLLIGPLGPAGAILSLVIARATFIALASRRTARRLGLSLVNFLPWRGLALMGLLAVATGVAAAFVTRELPVLPRLFAGGALAFASYTGIALAGGLVPASERQLFMEMFGRAFGRRVRSGRRRDRTTDRSGEA